jgi:hypothetical protein
MTAIHLKSRVQRHSLAMNGYVINAGGEKHEVGIENFSIDGCCVTGDHEVGESITVILLKIGSFTGQVRWSMSGKAGIRFERRTSK